MEVEEESGRFFPIIDIDVSLGIVQTPCKANNYKPNVIARYPNSEEGHRNLDKQLAKLDLHIWF